MKATTPDAQAQALQPDRVTLAKCDFLPRKVLPLGEGALEGRAHVVGYADPQGSVASSVCLQSLHAADSVDLGQSGD